MGYERVQGQIVARVSRHNSPRDDSDVRAWNELVRRINALLQEEPFTQIGADFYGDELANPRYQ